MTDRTDAWFPLWIGDYLADTMTLTRDEHGGYLLLLMAYWRNGGPLPDDDVRLRTIARASLVEWLHLRPTLAQFFDIGDGVWRHRRCDRELAAAGDRRVKARNRAERAAAARWHGATKGGASSMLEASEGVPAKTTAAPVAHETDEGKPVEPVATATKECPDACSSITKTMLEECPSPSPSPIKREEPPLSPPLPTGAPDAPQLALVPLAARPARTKPRTGLVLTDLPPAWRLSAERRLPGWDHDALWREFRGHHVGKGTLAASWPMTWATWLERAPRYSPHLAPGAGRPGASSRYVGRYGSTLAELTGADDADGGRDV